MGLDMYLTRSKKMEGFLTNDYVEIDNILYDLSKEEYENLKDNIDIITSKGTFNYLKSDIYECYESKTILDEAISWRKCNQIHKWFVDNVQNREDECGYFFVTKEHITTLLNLCKQVAKLFVDINKNKDKIANLLPTQSGFFFGSAEYDEWYMEDINDTIPKLEKVLEETDFDKQVLIYHSSW